MQPPNGIGAEAALEDIGTYICTRCIGGEDLRRWMRAHLVSHACTFCGREKAQRMIAVDADALVEVIADYIGQEYEDAAEHVPYESAEGGYQARTQTTDELLYEELELEETNQEAWQYIVANLPDAAWVQKDFFSLHPYDALRFGWSEFASAVKHETRYLFFPKRRRGVIGSRDDDDYESIRPAEMLRELGNVIRQARLVRKLPKGTLLYRLRLHNAKESPSTPDALGAPPPEMALYSNRMSPAGISMFYAAEDEATAIAEVTTPSASAKPGTMATFRLEEELKIVDFVRLRPVPLFGTDLSQAERARLHFVHRFAREVSHTIVKDGREHIEYVPTQIVTEYLRFRFRAKGKRVDGIRYASARLQGGVNVTLFIPNRDFLPGLLGESPKAPLTLASCKKAKFP